MRVCVCVCACVCVQASVSKCVCGCTHSVINFVLLIGIDHLGLYYI